jgi:hypothetical protein
MATINSDGKTAYIYNEENDTWYALAAAVNTNAQYTWTADQEFSAVVTLDSVVTAKAGVNNFQNPEARDLAIPSPTNGIVCFVRQATGGEVINQVQYYYNGEWRFTGDAASFLAKTADYTIAKDDAGKTISVDSADPVTITIPANSSVAFLVGQRVEVLRVGTGAVDFEAAVGVTIRSKFDNKNISAQYSGAVITKIDTNTWLLLGDLTA